MLPGIVVINASHLLTHSSSQQTYEVDTGIAPIAQETVRHRGHVISPGSPSRWEKEPALMVLHHHTLLPPHLPLHRPSLPHSPAQHLHTMVMSTGLSIHRAPEIRVLLASTSTVHSSGFMFPTVFLLRQNFLYELWALRLPLSQWIIMTLGIWIMLYIFTSTDRFWVHSCKVSVTGVCKPVLRRGDLSREVGWFPSHRARGQGYNPGFLTLGSLFLPLEKRWLQ